MPTAMRSRIAPPAISVMRRLQTRPAVPTADLAKGRGKRNCRRKLPTNRAPRLARGKPPTTRAHTAHLTTPLLTAMIVMSASRMASCGGRGWQTAARGVLEASRARSATPYVRTDGSGGTGATAGSVAAYHARTPEGSLRRKHVPESPLRNHRSHACSSD